MEEKKKNKKVIGISIISVVALITIIGTVAFLVINAQKLKIYNATIELGQENYIEELAKQENVYIKEGYTYSVKDSKIDINNVGIYDLTFEIKGEGRTTEETKKIEVKDTTPPTVKLKQDTFYIGDTINIEEIVSIKDLSQTEEISYSEAKAQVIGEFDTSKEGESQVTISVTDKNGNTGTQELKIKVEKPKISLYEYVMKVLETKNSRYTNGTYDDKFVLKFSYNFGNGLSAEGWINYTEKKYYQYSRLSTAFGTAKTSELTSFDSKGKVTNVYVNNKQCKEDLSTYQNSLDNEMKNINDLLENNSNKINLIGKTVDQLKNETIDLRELK